jgi:hypothetical protein
VVTAPPRLRSARAGEAPLRGDEHEAISRFRTALGLADVDAAPVHIDVGRRILRGRLESGSRGEDIEARKTFQKLIYVSNLAFGDRQAAFLLPWQRVFGLSDAQVRRWQVLGGRPPLCRLLGACVLMGRIAACSMPSRRAAAPPPGTATHRPHPLTLAASPCLQLFVAKRDNARNLFKAAIDRAGGLPADRAALLALREYQQQARPIPAAASCGCWLVLLLAAAAGWWCCCRLATPPARYGCVGSRVT